MTPQNKLHAFNLASPYSAEMADIERRNQMAQMLQQQSFQPTEKFSYGGIEARTPATAHLAKLLQGLTGMYMQQKGADEQKALVEREQGYRSRDFATMLQAMKGSAATPEVRQEPTGAEFADNPNLASTFAGMNPEQQRSMTIPAMAARAPGQIDPAMISQLRTPEAQNQAMTMYMAQLAQKPSVILGPDQIAYDPVSWKERARGGTKPTFGQPITEISPTGQISRVVYDNTGARKVIETAGSVPQDQWNSISLADRARITFDQFKFGNFSATDLANLRFKNVELGNAVAKLIDEGIPGSRAGPILPAVPGVPPVIPSGLAGALQQSAPQQGIVQQGTPGLTPSGVVGGAPIAPRQAMPSSQPPAGIGFSRTPPPVAGGQPDRRPGEAGSAYRARIAKIPEGENTLRDEYNKLTGDFRTVQDSYSKIMTVANTGAGDMSLLYSYVKLLDPNSVVRESEFATAAASGSFGERVQGAMQRVMTGQRLPDTLRADFINEATNIYKAQQGGADRLKAQYTEIAKRRGLNPQNVIVDYRATVNTPDAVPLTSQERAELEVLRKGVRK